MTYAVKKKWLIRINLRQLLLVKVSLYALIYFQTQYSLIRDDVSIGKKMQKGVEPRLPRQKYTHTYTWNHFVDNLDLTSSSRNSNIHHLQTIIVERLCPYT